MTAKEATYQVLDEYDEGDTFSGLSLKILVHGRTAEYHYPATMLRYMRSYRRENGVKIVCVNKRKSLYRIGE